MIHGNIDGIKDSVLKQLDQVYEIRSQRYEIAALEILDLIKVVTERINREISVTIDRRGHVTEVTIGDSASVSLPVVDVTERKLSGFRIVHTHPNGLSKLSALDLSATLKMRLDCMAALACNTEIPRITLGFPTVLEGALVAEVTREMTIEEALAFNIDERIKYNQELLQDSKIEHDDTERALLVGIESQDSLEELKELANAADIEVSQLVLQSKEKADTQYYMGSGKLEELSNLAQLTRSNVIIADDELSGTQIKNMEDLTGVKVIDRTTLILEIFSRRARSREAKLQVELAQLKYRMSRLLGLGIVMSRTGGGIGTRGPGETKLETDRRRIRNRHHDLTEELKGITKVRATQRENRYRQELPQIALVGYTNSGKSTLRNALAETSSKDAIKKEKVYEADMLFATLDTTTRAIELPDKRIITVTDTVGFIRKLPHDLVEAFKSTLEEVIYADILIHVVDASSQDAPGQVEAVEQVLEELGAVNKPMILALNKADLGVSAAADLIRAAAPESVPVLEISAKTGLNLDHLLVLVQELLPQDYNTYELLIPYSMQKLVSLVHQEGNVLEEEFGEDGTRLRAQLATSIAGKLKEFILPGEEP
ncbi:MAG: GTPase HflX [Clostridiaceae bacterium]